MKEIKKIELTRTFWETKAIITIYNVTFEDDTIITVNVEKMSQELLRKCTDFIKDCNTAHWEKRKAQSANLKGVCIYATYENK